MTEQQNATGRLVPLDDARFLLGSIGRTKLYEIINAGQLRLVKIGRRSFLTEADLSSYIAVLVGRRAYREAAPQTDTRAQDVPDTQPSHRK